MKYVVVSIYDCGFDFCVCDNGKFIPAYDDNNKSCEELSKYNDFDSTFYNWLKNKYKDYDLIIVCEDGGVKIVVDKTK